jgi:hypothetical protein
VSDVTAEEKEELREWLGDLEEEEGIVGTFARTCILLADKEFTEEDALRSDHIKYLLEFFVMNGD